MKEKIKKGTLLALFFTVFVDMIGVGIVIPVFPLLFADSHSGVFASEIPLASRLLVYGFLAACYPLAQFFGAPILGALSDRYGRKPILTISLFGTLVGYILFAWSVKEGNLYLMFFSRALDGFSGGNISIAMSSIADISDAKSKTKNFGLIGMAFGLGFILGPYIGGKLADPSIVSWFSYATPFWAAAFLALCNLFLISFIYKETIKTKVNTPVSFTTGFKNIGKAFSVPNLRVIFTVLFFLTFGFSFFTQFFQIFLSEKFKYTSSQVGDIFAYIGVWIALTQGGLTRILSKIVTPVQIMSICIFILGITFFVLVVPDDKIWIFLILPFVAINQGLIAPNSTTLVSAQAPNESQGEILGISQSVQSLAQAIPPIIAGIIVSINLELPILVAATCTLLAGIIFVLFFKRNSKKFNS